MLDFSVRFFKHLFLLLFVCLPLQFLGILIIPLILLGIKDEIRFPTVFKWFDNADVWLNRDSSTYLSVINQGFLARYYWLAIRNPLNYFGYKVLGIEVMQEVIVSSTNNNYNVGDSQGHDPGLLKQEVQINNKNYYEYYLIYKWNQTHCLRFRMGYKIGRPESNKINDYIQEVFVFQPFKSYTGN